MTTRTTFSKCFSLHNYCCACPKEMTSKKQSIIISQKNDGNFRSQAIGPECLKKTENSTEFFINIDFTKHIGFNPTNDKDLIRYVILRQFLLPKTDSRFQTQHKSLEDPFHEIITTGRLCKYREQVRKICTNRNIGKKLFPHNIINSYLAYDVTSTLLLHLKKDKESAIKFTSSIKNALLNHGFITEKQVETLNKIQKENIRDEKLITMISNFKT